jgi:hypothetical protein
MYRFNLFSIITIAALLPGVNTQGAELLQGKVSDDPDGLSFQLSGESRKDIIGGVITLGDRTFTITHVSRLGTIGARQDGDNRSEFAVFSSSFSEQTATGQPWVASLRYNGCEQPYNSFLALYRVIGESALQALGEVPYRDLTDDVAHSTESEVYCFISRPPPG